MPPTPGTHNWVRLARPPVPWALFCISRAFRSFAFRACFDHSHFELVSSFEHRASDFPGPPGPGGIGFVFHRDPRFWTKTAEIGFVWHSAPPTFRRAPRRAGRARRLPVPRKLALFVISVLTLRSPATFRVSSFEFPGSARPRGNWLCFSARPRFFGQKPRNWVCLISPASTTTTNPQSAIPNPQ